MQYGPIAPYQSVFITARPGMGATTLATCIANAFLDTGARCLIFANAYRLSAHYAERIRLIREGGRLEDMFRMENTYGKLTVVDNNYLESYSVLRKVEETSPDVVIFEEPYFLAMKERDLVLLSECLRSQDICFVFVTHIKRRRCLWFGGEQNTPQASLHRRLARHMDAVCIPYREEYYREERERCEEIRIYERGARSYRCVRVEFDFSKQRVVKK